MFTHPCNDGLHPLAFDSEEHLENIVNFNWAEVERNLDGEEPDKMLPFSEVTALFSMVLDYITSSREVRITASRAHALGWLLWPESSKFKSLSEIAEFCGCTKAAISKSLLDFRDATGLRITAGKGFHTRDKFRVAQNTAVERGTHTSNRRTAGKS